MLQKTVKDMRPVDGVVSLSYCSIMKEQDLYTALLSLKNRDEFARFFKDLCTPREIIALSERWHVAQLLYDGTRSYREIQAMTGASLATITRVARFLKDEPYQGYKIVLNKRKK